MKIVHVGYAHRPNDIRIFQKECTSLAKYGHEVIYVTSEMNGEFVNDSCSNVEVITVKLQKTNKKLPFLLYCKDVKKVLDSLNADVYHFHEVVLLSVLLYMRKKGKRVIYDMHEDYPRQLQPGLYRRRGKILGTLLITITEIYENYCIRKADYVITATPHIEERCKKLTNTVTCIANYPIIYNDKNDTKSFVEREKIVCYTGGISETNGVFSIVKAMEQVDGTLHLAGNLPKELREQLMEYDGWSKVCELGYVGREEVQKVLQESMAGLVVYLPAGNTVEALPNKLFEYMEAALPVIVSDFPLWKEIVEKNQCGICVNPNAPEEIAEAINRILSNPKWAEEMGRNGKRLIQEKCNWGGGRTRTDQGISENQLKKAALCYCGGMSEERNISMYVKMMEYIEGTLLLAGSLDASYRQQLENIKSWNKVEHLGYLDPDGVKDLYEKSCVGLCILRNTPNIYYSLPIKLFEYMEAGLPIVCSDFPIWREIVEGNNCGLTVPYNDLESAVKAVQYILDNPMTALVMGENGRKAVKEKYNWETEEKKLLQIYAYLGKHLQ